MPYEFIKQVVSVDYFGMVAGIGRIEETIEQ